MQHIKILLGLAAVLASAMAIPAEFDGAQTGTQTVNTEIEGRKVTATGTGAVAGNAQASGDQASAQGAIAGVANGNIEGFGNFAVEGAAAGGASADRNNGVSAAGAAAGRGSADGIGSVEGAVAGRAKCDANGNCTAEGAVNGCYKLPNSQTGCYVKVGKAGPGFYGKDGVAYGALPGSDWVKVDKPDWYDENSQSIKEGASSDASSLTMGAGALMALAALAL